MRDDLEQLFGHLHDLAGQYAAAATRAEKSRLQSDYLKLIAGHFIRSGLDLQDAMPLIERLIDWGAYDPASDEKTSRDLRRPGSPASEPVLARAAAMIDLLMAAGRTEDAAAQTLARQMVLSGLTLPKLGDPRGWRGLQMWRRRLIELREPVEAWDAYVVFRAEMAALSPTEVEPVLHGRTWDRRQRATLPDGRRGTP